MDDRLSIVISCYNEKEALPLFYDNAKKILDDMTNEYEMIFVDDGSIDNTGDILDRLSDDRSVKVIHFSRNFGHEAAMIAGIDHATGDRIICLDADMQHPPIYIPKINDKFDEGYDTISMIRISNKDAGLIKNISSSIFYSLINHMAHTDFYKNASDFFAIDKKVADILRKEYRERVRFLRGYVRMAGFNQTILTYEAPDRVAGKSKYSIRKLARFAIDTIVSWSDIPLKLGIYAGICTLLAGIIIAIVCTITHTILSSLVMQVILIILIGIILSIIGISSLYIGLILREVQHRPIYIIKNTKNID